jgi:AraC-like DNA-binding protein
MYIRHQPAPPLATYIDCLWLVNDRVPYQREKILPSGTIEVMLNFGSPHRLIDPAEEHRFSLMRHSWVAGFQTGYLLNEPIAETLMLGVRFKPGGAYPFFDLPIAELSNAVIDLDLIWGRAVNGLRERLAEAPSPAAKFSLMEDALRGRLADDLYGLDAVQYAARRLAHTNGALPIRDLSAATGYSQKHLNHQFKKMVGVTPKNLARVLRFQAALNSIDPARPVNWAEVAARCHYYDQAHFNHDFQAFTGLNPSAYVQLRTAVFGELQPGEAVHFVPIG